MLDQVASPARTPNLQPPAVCEECKSIAPKYKCPGCAVRSCSLPCVKAHKQWTGCTGKRNQTHFVPLSQFDDNLILSDYNLLEEVKRVAESARRTRAQLCGYAQFKLPYALRSLRNAARSRRTKLLFLPSGMLKREKNQSKYDPRKKCISWTIEWRFQPTEVVLLDHGVHEDTKLYSIIEKHLESGPWNNQLRQFSTEKLDSLKLFIRYQKGPRSPYRELDINASVREQLANLVLLEYPVIHVFLPSQNYNFEIVKDVKRGAWKTKPECSVSNEHLNYKGIIFKEEEIEEDNSPSDPRVFDAMKHDNSNSNSPMAHRNKWFRIQSNNMNDAHLLDKMEAFSGSSSTTKSKEPLLSEDFEFDFDQGLIGMYSELIPEINPADFLNIEDELAEQMEEVKRGPGTVLAEEVEEGEIQE